MLTHIDSLTASDKFIATFLRTYNIGFFCIILEIELHQLLHLIKKATILVLNQYKYPPNNNGPALQYSCQNSAFHVNYAINPIITPHGWVYLITNESLIFFHLHLIFFHLLGVTQIPSAH